jgi:hypothetical protein
MTSEFDHLQTETPSINDNSEGSKNLTVVDGALSKFKNLKTISYDKKFTILSIAVCILLAMNFIYLLNLSSDIKRADNSYEIREATGDLKSEIGDLRNKLRDLELEVRMR